MAPTAEALAVAAHIARTLEHRPGGENHDQSKHGRGKAGPAASTTGEPPAEKAANKAHASKAHVNKQARKQAPANQSDFGRLTAKDAQALQERMLANEPWTDEQQEALELYTGDDYEGMNGALRGGTEKAAEYARDKSIQKMIQDGNAAMRPLPQGVRLFRNTGPAAFGLDSDSLRDGLDALEGKTFQERGFMSTSIDRTKALREFGDIHIELSVPAGTRAAFVKSLSHNKKENEMVLAPGTKIRVTSVDSSVIPHMVRAEVIA